MIPFARRVRTIRMCSLDARGSGPIQATLLKASNTLLRPCLGQGASRRTRVGRVRSPAFLSILRDVLVPMPFRKSQTSTAEAFPFETVTFHPSRLTVRCLSSPGSQWVYIITPCCGVR